MVVGELQRRCLDRVGDDRLDETGHQELPAPPRPGIVVGQGRHEARHRLPVAAQEPEDPGCDAGLQGEVEPLVLVEPGALRLIAGRGDRSRGGLIGRGLLIALGDHDPRLEACLVRVLRRDPGRVGFESEPLQLRADGCCRGMLAGRRRGGLTGLGVDPVDLGQPVARGRLERVGSLGGLDRRSEAALGGVLRIVDGPRVRAPRRGDGRRFMGVVGPLRESEGVQRCPRLGACAGRELAALVRQAALVGAPLGRRRRARRCRRRRRDIGRGAGRLRLGLAVRGRARDRAARWRSMPPSSSAPRESRDRAGRSRVAPPSVVGLPVGPMVIAFITGSSPVEIGMPTRPLVASARGGPGGPLTGSAGSMVVPGTGAPTSRLIGMAPGILAAPTPPAPAVVGGGANRTVVRRSAAPRGCGDPMSRRSAGPPRAGSGAATVKASSASVAARRGIASCATVSLTWRGEGGRARTNSMRAAPLTRPRTRPSARKLNSLAVTPSASRGSCSFAFAAPWPAPA